MPLPVRVIGRIDLAEKICAVLAEAGMDAELVTAAPTSVYTGKASQDGVDVVIATGSFDPPLWRWFKRRHPLRPMVAVAERRLEAVLRGAVARRRGPDAYVTWPCTAADLTDAVQRAIASAGLPRRWGRADTAAVLTGVGPLLLIAPSAVLFVLGALLTSIGLLVGMPFARWPRVQAALGVLLALGVALLVVAASKSR